MADQIYKAIPTIVGLQKIQQAIWAGVKVQITYLAYGDGNGEFVDPTPDMTQLVHQVGITDTEATVMDIEENITWVSATIGSTLPNCTIREVGLYDSDGDLCFIANTPEIDKVEVSKGTLIDIPLELGIKNEYAAHIEIPLKPSANYATKQWVISNFATRDLDNITAAGKQVIHDIAWGPIVFDAYLQVVFDLPPEYDPTPPPPPDPDEEIIESAYWEEIKP